jgi:hypothetical protein
VAFRLDGSGGGDLPTTGATTSVPTGVAIDPVARQIYWANFGANKISFANLDGSGGGDVPTLAATVSEPSFPVLLHAPQGAGPPAIAGGSAIGSVLSCSQASWAPDLPASLFYRAPASFAFQWSVDGHEIAGATASSYTAFTAGDYHCTVTASNAAGSVTQTSAPHAVAATTAAGGALVRPTISALRETNRVFRVGRSSTPADRPNRRHSPQAGNRVLLPPGPARDGEDRDPGPEARPAGRSQLPC